MMTQPVGLYKPATVHVQKKKNLTFTTHSTNCVNMSTYHNWIKWCAKYILVSLLNKLVDFKHLNFAGKSFHIHAVL